MANSDRPRGFRVGYTLHGGPPHLGRYYKADSNIFIGMPVCLTTLGYVGTWAGTTGTYPIGVSATYSTAAGSSAGADEVYVYDDLANTVFIAQADGSDIAGTSVINQNYGLTACSATTASSNQQSNAEIDSDDAEGCLWVIDKVDRPDNAWGAYVDCYVKIIPTPIVGTTARQPYFVTT